MKIFSLVFDYNISKLRNTGRPWADKAYKNKEFIFEYSAASIATFLNHNSHLTYDVLTDDENLLDKNLLKYKVNTRNLNIINANKMIDEWTTHWYCFWPLIKVFDYHLNKGDDVIKLDNDLTCLKNIDELLKHKGALVWKKERLCSSGKDYWGEKYAAVNAFGTDSFFIYNTGIWGLSKEWHESAKMIPEYCERMISVDISSVSRFPESPGLHTKVFNTSDQVSNCYFLHKNNIPILETSHLFNHHCYSHDAKKDCIQQAKYLLK